MSVQELVTDLYKGQDTAYLTKAWNKFALLPPDMRCLNCSATRSAIEESRRRYPISALRNSLFPDQSVEEANESFRIAMNRGAEAFSAFLEHYVDKSLQQYFNFPSISYPLNLHDFIVESYRLMKKGIEKQDKKSFLDAYILIRAVDIGYRVVMVDDSFPVLYSEESFQQVSERLKDLLGVRDSTNIGNKMLPIKWGTYPGISIYCSDDNPFRSRIKSLGSMLLKMYYQLQFLDAITDCIGVEVVVEDDEDRGKLLDYLRDETRFTQVFEKLKSNRDKKMDASSSSVFDVVKFVWRMPLLLTSDSPEGYTRNYPRVPIEFQIYTRRGIEIRESASDANHEEYKKRQFLKVFPVLFPQQIYVPYLEAIGLI
ncbi:MAG: hypothetical protein HY831_00405 [Candidatus Aenigmarchaeota archaeon]|nr:hypothetical protein [Candidatus Aenigmarchaeota archaeon]